jgi:very-short-patch-repair endonuclease
MSDAEKVLWTALRETFTDQHWRHQVPFGPYTADFCSHRAKLVIEVDGGQHARPGIAADDARRTDFLVSEGYQVLRFWNHDVLGNVDGVLQLVARQLGDGSRLQ